MGREGDTRRKGCIQRNKSINQGSHFLHEGVGELLHPRLDERLEAAQMGPTCDSET